MELGKNLGMEMKEVRDIWEAYEFLTGKALARDEPVSESLMQLSPGPADDGAGENPQLEGPE